MTTPLDKPELPTWKDGIRYTVPSRSDPHETHLVELTDYSGNGSCSCTDFDTRFRPLLSRMVTTEQALEEKLVRLREYQRPCDALRCWHIIQGRDKFTNEVLAAIAAKERDEARGQPPEV